MSRRKNPRTEIVKAIRDARNWITSASDQIRLNSGTEVTNYSTEGDTWKVSSRKRQPKEYIENNRAELLTLYTLLTAAELDLARARRLVNQRMQELEAGK